MSASSFTVPDVLSGHLGHLSPSQAEAFATFKDSLTKAGLYTPGTDDRRASHDDPTLLRFLRARKWSPAKAQKQFADTEAWRKEHDVDALFRTFDAVEFEDARRFYPRWTGRRDRQGLPVYVYRLASLQPIQKELNAVPAPRRYQRIVGLYEALTNFVIPFCSHLPHAGSPTPISSVTTIIDLDAVSFSSIWSLRSHLQQASTLATANYPETLCTTIVVNAPSFFPTIWGWVKAWFDEGTRNKVHIFSKDEHSLANIRSLIAPADLPQAYGGDLAWTFEDEPALDAEARVVLGEMPKGPAAFVDGKVVPAENPGPGAS